MSYLTYIVDRHPKCNCGSQGVWSPDLPGNLGRTNSDGCATLTSGTSNVFRQNTFGYSYASYVSLLVFKTHHWTLMGEDDIEQEQKDARSLKNASCETISPA